LDSVGQPIPIPLASRVETTFALCARGFVACGIRASYVKQLRGSGSMVIWVQR